MIRCVLYSSSRLLGGLV